MTSVVVVMMPISVVGFIFACTSIFWQCDANELVTALENLKQLSGESGNLSVQEQENNGNPEYDYNSSEDSSYIVEPPMRQLMTKYLRTSYQLPPHLMTLDLIGRREFSESNNNESKDNIAMKLFPHERKNIPRACNSANTKKLPQNRLRCYWFLQDILKKSKQFFNYPHNGPPLYRPIPKEKVNKKKSNRQFLGGTDSPWLDITDNNQPISFRGDRSSNIINRNFFWLGKSGKLMVLVRNSMLDSSSSLRKANPLLNNRYLFPQLPNNAFLHQEMEIYQEPFINPYSSVWPNGGIKFFNPQMNFPNYPWKMMLAQPQSTNSRIFPNPVNPSNLRQNIPSNAFWTQLIYNDQQKKEINDRLRSTWFRSRSPFEQQNAITYFLNLLARNKRWRRNINKKKDIDTRLKSIWLISFPRRPAVFRNLPNSESSTPAVMYFDNNRKDASSDNKKSDFPFLGNNFADCYYS